MKDVNLSLYHKIKEIASWCIGKLLFRLSGFWRQVSEWPAGVSVAYSSIYILLSYRNNIFDIPPGQLVMPLLLALAFVYISHWVFKWLIKERVPTELATLAFTIFTVQFGTWFTLFRKASESLLDRQFNDLILGGLFILGGFATCWLLGMAVRKHKRYNYQILVFLQAGLFSFLGLTIITIGYLYVANWRIFAFETPQRDLNPSSTTDNPPDIYYFVFDRYANNETIEKYMSHSNKGFIAELEERGFLMNRLPYSSYPHTATSLPSTLNMKHLNELTSDLPPKYSELVYGRMMNQSNAIRELKESGYQINWSGSWWGPTRTNRLADVNYDDLFKAKIIGFSFTMGEWQGLLLAQHLLGRVMASDLPLIRNVFHYDQPHQRDLVNAQFESAKSAVNTVSKKPKFSYLHVLSPHPGYVFDENCNPPQYGSEARSSDPRQIEKYVNQLKCLNTKILKTVDYILENSPRPPIIVFQPDEGPYLFALENGRKLNVRERARWKHGILSAIYLPGFDQPDFYSVGSVNVISNIMNSYLGYNIELTPLKFYTYTRQDPYYYKDISDYFSEE